MNDYALKFLDEAEATSILYRKEGVIEASEGIEANAGHDVANYQNIDILGTLYIQSGTIEEPISTALDGWHVNVRQDYICPELTRYEVFPRNPKRIFA